MTDESMPLPAPLNPPAGSEVWYVTATLRDGGGGTSLVRVPLLPWADEDNYDRTTCAAMDLRGAAMAAAVAACSVAALVSYTITRQVVVDAGARGGAGPYATVCDQARLVIAGGGGVGLHIAIPAPAAGIIAADHETVNAGAAEIVALAAILQYGSAPRPGTQPSACSEDGLGLARWTKNFITWSYSPPQISGKRVRFVRKRRVGR